MLNIYRKTPLLESLFNKTVTHIFSCKFCQIFTNTYFEECLRTTASINSVETRAMWAFRNNVGVVYEAHHIPSNFWKAVFHKYYLVHSSIPCLIWSSLDQSIKKIWSFLKIQKLFRSTCKGFSQCSWKMNGMWKGSSNRLSKPT